LKVAAERPEPSLLTFSAVTLEFSAVTMDNPEEKVPSLALYFGLFLQLQWKVRFFYSYAGNPTLPKLIL
jgi:hypothetical protein